MLQKSFRYTYHSYLNYNDLVLAKKSHLSILGGVYVLMEPPHPPPKRIQLEKFIDLPSSSLAI